MIDYEALILDYQEAMEIWEDDPDSPYIADVTEYFEEVNNNEGN